MFKMIKDYAKIVIHYIGENPKIHYDDLLNKFPDEEDEGRLFRLLYGLCERGIIMNEDLMDKSGRGLERSIFSKGNYTRDKLNETFSFWKL